MDGTGLIYNDFQQSLAHLNIHLTILHYPTNQVLTQPELLNQLDSALQQQNRPVWLIGESFGGHLAYQLAQQYPEKVNGLILVASFLTPPFFLLKLTPTLLIQASWLLLQKVGLLRKLAISVLLNKSCSDIIKAKLSNAIKQVDANVIASRFIQIKRLNIKSGQNNCHYLKPTSDLFVSNKAIHQLSQLFNKSICYPIKGTHFLLQTNPEKCAEVVYKIIREEYTCQEDGDVFTGE
ncbi:alpha/beta fold hydrolase [Endozoicomonas sp. SM1973]|uniref:Alpha/beta fold hydrolase n=1 Tax=Spartinivicinus marinus TaxID=2994442 RepID=A0A853IBJ2_9GAMM|nr:alpha/beta fold hydrolase [Spartinivicinus marinus]MCX4026525.1 alpha/beta fold hydrolase [Spartinivicinus marinus]NYZ66897.1 alpha/beta fold hydrolase [Spartinivicinus marinus]